MSTNAYTAYKVRRGDCMSSIAGKHGLTWEAIWHDPKNADLKERRRDPNVLMEGDLVYIRNTREKTEPGVTEQRHRFRVLNQPAMLRLRVLTDDQPRANERYSLNVAGIEYEGTTDTEGKLEHPIPPTAEKAVLKIGNNPDDQDEYELVLGAVDLRREVRGAQQRLYNLGFDPGPIDGILGPKTEEALRAFQKKNQLQETGLLDRATGEKLVEVHGC